MTNEDLIAQARGLCERIARNAGRQIALESSINALDEETYNYYAEIQRLATTHLAEMDEQNLVVEHLSKSELPYDKELLEVAIRQQVTKAKRLLGVE